jgi:YVTN family beta-propeller protein
MVSKMLFILTVLIVMILMSCEKDPASSKKNVIPEKVLKGVFIVNEGSFTAANTSLSYFDSDSGKMYNNVFHSANGVGLGSVANSITIYDTLAYIVVNNSDKVEVININSFKQVATIQFPAGSSPRNMVLLNALKAYVTNLYTNNCSIVDLTNYQIAGSIATGANPEGLLIANSKLFVANSGFGNGNTVTVISTSTDGVLDTVKVGDNPISVNKDNNKNVYVLCSGSYGDWADPNDDTPGGVWKIDSNTHAVVDSFIVQNHPSRLCLGENNEGYFINNGAITEFNYQNMQVVDSSLVFGNFYGLNFDPISQLIYALDPKDYFSQNGEMIIFDQLGIEKARYEVGLIPGTLAFYSY